MTTNTLGTLSFAFKLDGSEVHWRLLDAYLEEGLGALPMYTFDIVTTDFVPESVLSKDLVFELRRDDGRDPTVLRRGGVVVGVEILHHMDQYLYRTRLRVSSRGFALGIGRRSRIFQQKNAVDIATQVFSEAGMALETQGSRPLREMCVQYHESDYDFLRRLCEDEGLTLVFDADGRSIQVARRPLADGRGQVFGELVMVRDVTPISGAPSAR